MPEETKEEGETKKEKIETETTLTPVNEPRPVLLSERDAKALVCEIYDISLSAMGALNLPPTSKINRSANFYLEEILRTLKEYNIIE